MNVDLRDGITGDAAGIGDVDLNLSGVAGLDAGFAQTQIVESESCVAEAIAEWIERLALDIPVTRGELGAVFRFVRQVMAVVKRLLAGGVRPADGKFSAWVHITEEDVGHGVAAFGAGIPRFEDGPDVLRCPAEIEGAAVLKDEDNRFTRGGDSLEHLRLNAGQFHGGA